MEQSPVHELLGGDLDEQPASAAAAGSRSFEQADGIERSRDLGQEVERAPHEAGGGLGREPGEGHRPAASGEGCPDGHSSRLDRASPVRAVEEKASPGFAAELQGEVARQRRVGRGRDRWGTLQGLGDFKRLSAGSGRER
jgi:hypothetical protein